MIFLNKELFAKVSKSYLAAMALFLVVMFCAAAAYSVQYTDGLIRTNLSNGFSWGLYVSSLAFFVGNAAGGLVLSSSIYMFGLTNLKPFARLGALTAFVSVIAAMLSILPDIGQPLRLLNLIIYPQTTSPLLWDVIVLNIYALLTLIYLVILVLPDLPAPVKELMVRQGDLDQFSDKWARRLAPVALLFAVSIHIVTAWIFSTQGGREWWFTAALAPDFISVAVMAGTTVVLLSSIMLFGIKEEYGAAYKTMTGFICAAFIVHVFLMYNDMFIKTWYHAENGMHAINLLFGDFKRLHIFEVAAPLLAVLLLLGKVVWKSRITLAATCLLLLGGVMAHRYLIMPPAFNVQPLTFNPVGHQLTQWSYPVATGRWIEGMNTFADKWNYVPSGIEFMIFAGVCAFACFSIGLGAMILPITVTRKH